MFPVDLIQMLQEAFASVILSALIFLTAVIILKSPAIPVSHMYMYLTSVNIITLLVSSTCTLHVERMSFCAKVLYQSYKK